MRTVKKIRLDQRVHQEVPGYSRKQVQAWIEQGLVLVEGLCVTRPGAMVPPQVAIIVSINSPKYVSRAGFKLEKMLDAFTIDVTNLVVLDAGLSTGGFTDCLLQRGACRVYGIDVGHDQVHNKIKNDPRVIIHEGTNLRTLESVGEQVDLITLDLSFISVLKVLDAVCRLLKPNGMLIVLIKPQFEVEKGEVARGVIKDSVIHKRVVAGVVAGVCKQGFQLIGTIDSPLLGGSGNKEFLAYFVRK